MASLRSGLSAAKLTRAAVAKNRALFLLLLTSPESAALQVLHRHAYFIIINAEKGRKAYSKEEELEGVLEKQCKGVPGMHSQDSQERERDGERG